MAMTVLAGACASMPKGGSIGEGSSLQPKIIAVDTGRPPRSATVQLDREGYVALVLVAPGHSATLLYPRDTATNNQLRAGAHQITFTIPSSLVLSDTAIAAMGRPRPRSDTARARARPRSRTVMSPPIGPETPTYLLLITAPQPLNYSRIVEKTAGVSIPNIDMEALNAVGKAIKATIATEPREWSGYYQLVELSRLR
jgi:hypothetical protein